MTIDKDLKRLVRNRSRKTGESYSLARARLLSKQRGPNVTTPSLHRVEKIGLGFAIHLPADWPELPAQPTNSPNEVARFRRAEGPRRSLCLVFRWSGLADASVWTVASNVRLGLEEDGFAHFTLSDSEFAGREGARLDCNKELEFGLWTVREYFVANGEVAYVLGTGTSDPESDGPIFDEMARRFELLSSD